MLKKPLSIKQLLTLGFFLTALLPMLIVTLLTFYQARTVLRDEIQSDMQIRAAAAIGAVDSMMFERMQNVASWSRLDVMNEVKIDDVDKRLSHFLHDLKVSYQGVYQGLYVVNQAGMVIASSEPMQIGEQALAQKHWMNILLAQHPLQLSVIQQKNLPISSQILDMDGQNIGTLWAIFDWSHIEKILKNTQIEGSAAALLDIQDVDEQYLSRQGLGQMKPYPKKAAPHIRVLAQAGEWQKIVSAHDVSVLSNRGVLAGNRDLVNVPLFNWQVAITQYRSVVMAPVHRMGYIFILLMLVTAVLAALVAALLSRIITKPLARLTSYAHRFMRTSQGALPLANGPLEVRAMNHAFGKMIEDLTLSKESLTRATKLAVAGEMAAALSHEIRTPLGILRSSAQVLSREKHLSAEGREVATFITTETERMNKLVSTLVDSARPRQPDFAMHDLVALVENAIAMLRMQANKKDISLAFVINGLITNGLIDEDLDIEDLEIEDLEIKDSVLAADIELLPAQAPVSILVECDGEQITQVVLNLLLNAIQILAEGSQVIVTLLEDAESVIISVADNGMGVSEALKEHIFDPFFTQRQGGIGLGLAVSRQIVTAHFGSLTVEANRQEASGADFRVKLPKIQLR